MDAGRIGFKAQVSVKVLVVGYSKGYGSKLRSSSRFKVEIQSSRFKGSMVEGEIEVQIRWVRVGRYVGT